MFIGLSYICLQFSLKQTVTDAIKSILLGLAFVLWGGEMLRSRQGGQIPPHQL